MESTAKTGVTPEAENRVYIVIDGRIIPVSEEEARILEQLYADTGKYSPNRRDPVDFKMYASGLLKKYRSEEISIHQRYFTVFSGVSNDKVRRVTSRYKGGRFL
jgi:hypothetical protein